jgi:FkbM family methyltransferase
MIFYDENNKIIDHTLVETVEQKYASEYIHEDDVVLELGARYGMASCSINQKLKNKKNQVVIEPDDRIWEALEKNRNINNCDFEIIKGFVSNYKLTLVDKDAFGGFGTTAMFDSTSTIPHYTMNEIYSKFNLKFNVLFADCEGFLEIFLDENPNLLTTCRLMIFEQDCPYKCNYDKIKHNLLQHGFKQIVDGFHQVWLKN